jgi:hypothetical protein
MAPLYPRSFSGDGSNFLVDLFLSQAILLWLPGLYHTSAYQQQDLDLSRFPSMYLSEKIIPWAGRRERDGELAGGQRSGAQPRRGRARTRETREGWLVRELFFNR